MVMGHANINAYLYRFKISKISTCPYGEVEQTTNYLVYKCDLLKTQRDTLRSTISKLDGWPTNKNALVTKHYKDFITFNKQIAFDILHYIITSRKEASNNILCKNDNKIM